MQSKADISYLILAVYVLMLVHTFIPHNHGTPSQRPVQIVLEKSCDGQGHRLHHQMPRHTHPKCFEYYLLEADDDACVKPVPGITSHIDCKQVQAPAPGVRYLNYTSYHSITQETTNVFIAGMPMRAPPTV